MNNQNKKSINDKELEILKFWQDNKIFEKSLRPSSTTFTFYDGPPFATGLPHHGSIMAGTVKDLIPRYQTMRGKRVRRVWGWDCHGLPIENMIEKELNLNSKKEIEEYGIDKFNQAAADSVLRYEKEWKQIIPRLGRWVDMERPYKTMEATYTESVWWSWKTLYDKGLAYEGHKIMHICPRCETPLAQSEVGLEYHDVTDISVTAKFELVDEPNTYVLAWTTTPWTLPGNTALAVHKDIDYVKVKFTPTLTLPQEEGTNSNFVSYYILAKSKVEEYFKDKESIEIVEEFKGEKLLGLKYKPPFNYFEQDLQSGKIVNGDNAYKIWHADFITDDTGTGIAHEAPAFGAEDMELAKANNIPVIKHVQMNGTFVEEVMEELADGLEISTESLRDLKVKRKDDTMGADIQIIRWLAKNHLIFEKHKIVHSYPLCWRCKTPLLNYATSSWFVDVPAIKDKLIAENNKVKWIPEHIRDGRFGKWLEGAREWAVSRRRYWGAPLPIWQSASGKVKLIGSLAELAELSSDKNNGRHFVMRHGESVSNVNNVYDDGVDPENKLTEKGKTQILGSIDLLKSKKINYIISSPILRTKESAELIAKTLGIEVFYDDRLRDVKGMPYDEVVINRVMASVEEYSKKFKNKNLLFIAHGASINMLLAGASLKTREEMLASYMPGVFANNGEVIEFDYKRVPRDATGAINLHRPYIDEVKLEIDGEEYTRIPDVFDCWYESGSMPYAQLHYPFENKDIFEKNFPADFIAESMDQTRGWFYSLINLAVGLGFEKEKINSEDTKMFGVSPYKHVICNGLINGMDGKKLSKSLKNYTDPMLLIDRFGADAFRYYLMSSAVIKGENVNFDDSELEDVYKKVISKLENVVSLYTMNLNSELKLRQEIEFISEHYLDQWILIKLNILIKNITEGYDNYKLDEATRPIEKFIDELSVWYVKHSRDRLKGVCGEEERNNSLSTLRRVLLELAKVMAPVMPFLAERVYKEVGGKMESVHLESWPKLITNENFRSSKGSNNPNIEVESNRSDNESLQIEKMKNTEDLYSLLLMERNKAQLPVRQPIGLAKVNMDDGTANVGVYLDLLMEAVNIKKIVINTELKENMAGEGSPAQINKNVSVWLDTNITVELKREGDQRELSRAIKDMRREMGLISSDSIILTIDEQRSGLVDDEYRKIMKITRVEIVKKQESNLSIEKA